MRAHCGGSRVSDQQPREEALLMDPASLEKHEASKTTMCAVRGQELFRKDDREQKPGESWKQGAPVEAGRSVGMEEQ